MDEEITIFIDESGDLGKFGSKHFIIAALCTTNPKPIYNLVKKVRQRKLKKSVKALSEIKANSSDDDTRRYVLNKISQSICHVHIIVVDKSKVKEYLFSRKDKLYNYIAGILVTDAQSGYKRINIIIDKKDHSSLVREDFNKYIRTYKNRWNAEIKIQHLESAQNRGLQAVDFIAWAAHRKYNLDEDKFYKVIEKKVVKANQLWDKNEADPRPT